MSLTLHVDIVSAEAQLYSGRAEAVFSKTILGEVGIFPGHAQLLAALKPGDVRLLLPGGEQAIFYVKGGLIEVQPHTVTILSDTAIRAEDLDEQAALEAKKAAEQVLAYKRGEFEYSKAATELAEAVAQIQTIQSLRKKLRK